MHGYVLKSKIITSSILAQLIQVIFRVILLGKMRIKSIIYPEKFIEEELPMRYTMGLERG